MVRNYKRKSDHAKKYKQETLQQAVNDIKAGVLTFKRANELHDIPVSTLKDHVKGRKGDKSSSFGRKPDIPIELEKQLADGLCCMEKCLGQNNVDPPIQMHTDPPNKQMEIDRSNCPSTNSDRDIQASTSGDISASTSSEDEKTVEPSRKAQKNDIAEDIQSEQDDWQNLGKNVSDMNIDDWVMVKFPGKKSIKHYVGQIANITNDSLQLKIRR
ncbi:hypothetical protein JTB14_002625 [Gonioctena quinquepunctata]|nr:hypothetical protein JTB14_002625 [Gonioctena quinquepunctata]